MANDPTVLIEVKLKDLFTQEFKKVQGEVAKFDQQTAPATDKAGRSFDGLISKVKGLALAYVSMRTVWALIDWGKQYGHVEAVGIAYDRLAYKIGATKGSVETLGSILRGTIDSTTIMSEMLRAMQSGAIATADDFTTLSKAAMVFSKDLGEDTLPTLQKLIDLTTSAAPRGLKVLGIDLEAALGQKQSELGRQLSLEEQRRVAIVEIQKKTNDEYDRASRGQVTINEKLQQGAVLWGDFKENVGYVIADTWATYALAADRALAHITSSHEKAWKEMGRQVGEATAAMAKKMVKPEEPPERGWWQTPEQRQADYVKDLGRKHGTTPYDEVYPKKDYLKRRRVQEIYDADQLIPGATQERMENYLRLIEDSKRAETIWYEYNAKTAHGVEQLWRSAELGVRRYSDSLGDDADIISEAFASMMSSMESSLEDVLVDSMMGKMKSFKEYMLSLVEDISRAIAKLMVRMMIMKPLMGALESGTGIDFGMGSEKPKEYAAGGISYSRQLAVVDAGEAHVPLVGGRSIPVEMKGGGGGGTMVFNFNGGDGQSIKRMLHQERDYLIALYREANRSDPGVRSAVRRTR